MATIISFPTRIRGDRLSPSQLDAVRVGVELLGADQAQRLPILLAAIANRTAAGLRKFGCQLPDHAGGMKGFPFRSGASPGSRSKSCVL